MTINIVDKRRFERYPVKGGAFFSDNENLIGFAKIIDISDCGVRCVSLSQVKCTICILRNIELSGTGKSTTLERLSGKMARCSDDKIDHNSDSDLFYYEFGFEFFPQHYHDLNRLKKSLCK
jgi:hypothetical protein